MRNAIPLAAVTVLGLLAISVPSGASKLSDLGKAVTYPAKKVVKNTGHDASHPVSSVTGPINQAGQTTTRTLHKVVK